MSEPTHAPVLLDRVVALVAPALERPGSVLVDATLGLGRARRGRPRPAVRRPAWSASTATRTRWSTAVAGWQPFAERVTLVHAVYDEIPQVLEDLGLEHVDGVLFDLGVSSMQLDLREPRLLLRRGRPAGHADGRHRRTHRGRGAQHLPGRPSSPGSCATTARSGSPAGSPSGSSASASREPFDRSARLVDLVREAIPAATRRTGGNPAKRTFQALRIEVNDELAVLRRALPVPWTPSVSGAGSW